MCITNYPWNIASTSAGNIHICSLVICRYLYSLKQKIELILSLICLKHVINKIMNCIFFFMIEEFNTRPVNQYVIQ